MIWMMEMSSIRKFAALLHYYFLLIVVDYLGTLLPLELPGSTLTAHQTPSPSPREPIRACRRPTRLL